MIVLQKAHSILKQSSQEQSITERKISVTGLGYVGLMIAAAFAKVNPIIGFDISLKRIEALRSGHDINNELAPFELKDIKIQYTSTPDDLNNANFHIIAVPTPLNEHNEPDLSILLQASEMVGKHLKKDDIVVYESSVYPGATEEKCIPVLEQASGLICGKDFGVGYSPERINPADKEHTLANIPKIISASDTHTLAIIEQVYNRIVKVGTYKVSSIRAAEAVKVIENIQRDVNISLANEFAVILHALQMDSKEIFDAMKTKWNYLPFQPGLVGGHCIPVNSYYLANKAEAVGFHPEVILASRRMNEQMPRYIVDSTIQELKKQKIAIKDAKVAIFGLTYKENTPDVHDTKVIDLIQELKNVGIDEVVVHDPIADKQSAKKIFDIDLKSWDELQDIDVIILAVAHNQFMKLDKHKVRPLFKHSGLIMDVKGILDPVQFNNTLIKIWRL